MESIIYYLLASLVVISCVLAGANYLGWRLFGRPQHALMWSLTFALAGLQYGLNMARPALPSEIVFWQIVNMVAFTSVLFALWGHRLRLGLATSTAHLGLIFLGLSFISATFTIWYPYTPIRVAIAPLFTFIAMTHISLILFKNAREPRLAQYVAAGFHFLFGLTQGAAAVIALNFNPNSMQQVLAPLYHVVNFGFMPTLFIAMGISVIFLLATDLAQRLSTMALRDSLTELDNRRGYMAATQRVFAQCQRDNKPITIVLIDIDHFKRINDRYGHSFGDVALQHLASLLKECLRTEDVLGRIGGEEFAVTMAGMDSASAALVAARIRQQLNKQPVKSGRDELTMSASFGVAQWREQESFAAVLKRADLAMYEAKAKGRDTVVVSEMALPPTFQVSSS